MKTLEEIKDDYVRDKFLASHELESWVEFQNYFACRHPEWFEQHNNEVAKLYAKEVARGALKNVAENARVMAEDTVSGNKLEVASWTDSDNFKFSISKPSILNEQNIPNI